VFFPPARHMGPKFMVKGTKFYGQGICCMGTIRFPLDSPKADIV
jgi:hypothetical protein